ncbi:MAG: MoaD/ThiS family protein [Candidatus Bathyarchaeia archaeon]
MKVAIKGYGDMKRFLNQRQILELKEGAKIEDLIVALGGNVITSKIAYLGGNKLEDSTMIVLVNGRNIHDLDGYNTVLKEGDLVTFIPIIVGG